MDHKQLLLFLVRSDQILFQPQCLGQLRRPGLLCQKTVRASLDDKAFFPVGDDLTAKVWGTLKERVGDMVIGIIQQHDARWTLVDLGKVEALLPSNEQVPGERYRHGERIKCYISEVKKTSKGPQVIVSRTHSGLIKKLFELEVPEIYEGIVTIKSISREAGHRTKIAVSSSERNVDPVGACVGPKGSRVRMVVDELAGEKIDIVQYSDDIVTYIKNALSPAKVIKVLTDEDTKFALVVVPNEQLSLAIGREGQNARLAAKLTYWKIDIKSESQYQEELNAARNERKNIN